MTFADWLSVLAPYITMATCVAVWLFTQGKIWGKTEERLKSLEKSTKDCNCINHKQAITDIRKSHIDEIARYDNKLDRLTERLDDKFENLSTSIVKLAAMISVNKQDVNFINNDIIAQKHSPKTLTNIGLEIYNEFGGDEFISSNKTFLFEEIDKMKPQTAFDVENCARIILMSNIFNSIFNKLKLWVYNAPKREVSVNGESKYIEIKMSDVCDMIALPLRDLYLSEHKGIPTE